MYSYCALVSGLIGILALPASGWAHGLFPGTQTVQTMGERAWVRLEAANGRQDVTAFEVEVFNSDTWTPSRIAVATPRRLTIPTPAPGSMTSTNRIVSVLVDMNGRTEQRLRVCTKSVPQTNVLLPLKTMVNTRVCAHVIVRKFQR